MSHRGTSTCLSSDALRRFLDEQLDENEERELQDHLDGCSQCQKSLEHAAADRALWDGMRDFGVAQTVQDPSSDPRAIRLAEMLSPSDDPRFVGRLGNYEIIGIIGQGSTGIVLKALEPQLNRYVAIKALSPHLAGNGAARKRFEREGRAVAAVSHEHVVPIYAVDESLGVPYIVMQYVPGLSLLQRIEKTGPLGTCEVVRIGYQVALGLAAAHKQGIVHRDVKPANVLLEETVDRAMVTDFGLARVVDEGTMTRSGTISGTPQYMSPEQARGESIDTRTDLFSLGGLMYSACTARAPFRAETVFGIIHRVCETSPRPIQEINPDIAPWLVQFIDKLMKKRLDERFSSASEVASLLEQELAHLQNPTIIPVPERRWLDHEPEAKPTIHGVSNRPVRRKIIGFGVVILLLSLAVGFAGYRGWFPKFLTTQPASGGLENAEKERGGANGFNGGNLSALMNPLNQVEPGDEPVITWTRDESDTNSITGRFVQRVEMGLKVPANSRILVDSDLGNLELRQTELDYVSLVIVRRIESVTQAEAEKIASYQEVSVKEDETLTITSRLNEAFAARNGADRLGTVTYGLGIPAGMSVQVRSALGDINVAPITAKLELSVREGDIHCDSIDGDLWARAVGGEITAVSGCTGSVDIMATHGNVCAAQIEGTSRLRASDGNIYVGMNAGDVSAHATGGDIRVAAIEGLVRGHVETGNVYLNLGDSPQSAGSFSATNGDIVANLANTVAARVTAKGNFVPDQPLPETVGMSVNDDQVELTLNGGGLDLELTALTGEIRVNANGEPGSRSLGGSGDHYFSLGGSGNESARRVASREALAKTSGDARPGAMVPVPIENGGNIDGYTLYLPESYSASADGYPVIVYLQGGYGVGGEITRLNDWGLPRLIRDEHDLSSERNQLLLDTFIVISIHIQDGNYHDHPEVVKRILDGVSEQFQVDSSRVYVTGLSRGGHGTWGLCSELPDVFAAAVPIGGNDSSRVDYSVFKDIGVWIAHNQGDTTIEFENATSAAEKITAQANVEFQHFDAPLPTDEAIVEADYLFTHPNVDRHDAWTDVYTSTQFYRWLLQHRR